jgi:hypothetical protein
MERPPLLERQLIERFSDAVNAGLAQGHDESAQAYAALQSIAAEQRGAVEVLDLLARSFHDAQQPERFFDARVGQPNERFEQCYELLRRVFDEAEREPKDRFIAMINALRDPNEPAPLVLIGRFWRALGPQQYDAAGALRRFVFDPTMALDSIVSVLSANYMSLAWIRDQRAGIGAIGHLATRERFRRGQGHGTALLETFEGEVARIAAARGERLELIALEAQEESEAFWFKRGYRWARGTRYAQPPLDFDRDTGERFYDEVPETLMVKVPGLPMAASVAAPLLVDAVRTMYQNWCLARTVGYPLAAAQRAADYVMGKVLGDFIASLPPDGAPVPLSPPPHL